jgi:hypothetical protein
MLKQYYNKKKEYFIGILMTYILLFIGLTDTANALDSNKKNDNHAHFDFGTQPLGISQTTKKFYICANDSDKIQEDELSTITIFEKIEPTKKKMRQRNIHRWNIPDTRSRVNMNRWVKKTKKNRIAIHIDAPYISGDRSNAFKIQDNQCNQNTLFPGSTCQFDILFHPKNEGRQRANIIIPYSLKGTSNYYTILVTGAAQKNGQKKIALVP